MSGKLKKNKIKNMQSTKTFNDEEIGEVWDFKKHAREKSGWKGACEIIENDEWIISDAVDPKLEYCKIAYSPAWFKCFDEIIVNASDHWYKRLLLGSKQVSQIKVNFNPKTKEISVSNDGIGIPVYIHEKTPGIWWPEVIISREFTGTNLSKSDGIVGGTNGVGLKVVASLSKKMTVETVDLNRNKYYYQEFKNGLNEIIPPQIKNVNSRELTEEQRKSHTTITLLLDLEHMGYKMTNNDPLLTNNDPLLTNNDPLLVDMERKIITRVYLLASFVYSVAKQHKNVVAKQHSNAGCDFYYNGNKITSSLISLAKTIGTNNISSNIVSFQITGEPKYPWDVVLCLADKKFSHITSINGVHAEGGSHVAFFKKYIAEKLQPLIKKEFNTEIRDSAIVNCFILLMNAQIPNPNWTGHTKYSFRAKRGAFKDHVIAFKDIKAIWELIKPKLAAVYIEKEKKNDKTSTSTSSIPKYIKASKAGTRQAGKCSLFIPEGDSAARVVKSGITARNNKISHEYYGVFNIGGVSMNARKQVTEKKVNGENIFVKTNTFQKNKRLQELNAVLGLQYSHKYENTAEGDKQFKSLNYGQIIIMVDQDLDGVGNIFGQILNYFALFWPGLIRRGFIKRLETPVVRAFPKGRYRRSEKVQQFYLESEFDKWEKNADLSKWTIKYYKGLATHDKKEQEKLFENFDDHLFTYVWDENAAKNFEIFYGKDSQGRKQELSTPVDYNFRTRLDVGKNVSCSRQLKIETKAFQLEVIARKTPSAVDGLVISRRKVLAGARRLFANSNKTQKIFQLGGYVAKNMNYHHGDGSLNTTMINMAQSFIGANNMPLLLPIGDFGNRTTGTSKHKNGSNVAGSPRYIGTKLNKKLVDVLFPVYDDTFLEYVLEDGEICEPKYYIPIVPMSILEFCTTPGVGWKMSIWARDFKVVVANVRRMLCKEPIVPMNTKVWLVQQYDTSRKLIENKMSVIEDKNGTEYCLGSCSYNPKKNTVWISELPIRIWSEYFIDKLESKKKYVANVRDNTGDSVDIVVQLERDSLDNIVQSYGNQHFNALEHYLEIKTHMNSHINMISTEGAVLSFSNYEEPLKYWFPIRYEIYRKRIERLLIIARLKLQYHRSVKLFVEKVNAQSIVIYRLPIDKAAAILKGAKFDVFDAKLLFNPGHTPNDKLETLVLAGPGSNYDYLFSITQLMMMQNAIQKRDDDIAKLLAEINKLENSTIEQIWSEELDQLEKIVDEGLKSGWRYGDDDYNW